MEFHELKAKVEEQFKVEKPDFIQNTNDSIGLGQLELSPTQRLVFSMSNFRGKKYFDIRTWYQDDSGEWKPTKKGVHFSHDKFDDFEKVIKIFSEILQLDK